MTEKYNHQIVVLETFDGTARSKKQLREMWEKRMKKGGFSHYLIKKITLRKNKRGKEGI